VSARLARSVDSKVIAPRLRPIRAQLTYVLPKCNTISWYSEDGENLVDQIRMFSATTGC
jgi:hypothetical protein